MFKKLIPLKKLLYIKNLLTAYSEFPIKTSNDEKPSFFSISKNEEGKNVLTIDLREFSTINIKGDLRILFNDNIRLRSDKNLSIDSNHEEHYRLLLNSLNKDGSKIIVSDDPKPITPHYEGCLECQQ